MGPEEQPEGSGQDVELPDEHADPYPLDDSGNVVFSAFICPHPHGFLTALTMVAL